MTDRVTATYLIETPVAVERAAALMASEQSIGSFARVPGETDEVVERFGGRVERIDVLDEGVPIALATALPGSAARATRAEVTLSFPAGNFAPNVASLWVVLLGNLFELQELTGIRLLDFDPPAALADRFPGPAFGIRGTRAMAGIEAGPLIGTIVKPKLGLSPVAIAALVEELGDAGIDFVKDDECMTNPASAPFAARVDEVSKVLDRLADRHGRRPLYAFNISDDADQMCRNHDLVAVRGAACVMVSINACGPSALAQLRRNASLPIHAHRAGWGLFGRHAALGMDFRAYAKLWRLGGVDHLHIGGLQSKFYESDQSVLASAHACLAPFAGHAPVMPTISSGQWGGQAPDTYEGLGCDDVIYLAGGGILGHPLGPAAGVSALRQAWDAAKRKVPLADYARHHPELRASIEMFGTIRSGRAKPDG